MPVKNAVAKTWPWVPSYDGQYWSAYPNGDKPAGGAQYGLIFPKNGDAVGETAFRFTGAAMPNIQPLTILCKFYPFQQDGYFTVFFHGRTDGGFSGDWTYYGCHPYPQGGAAGTVHNWEISAEGNDDIVDENGNSTVVTKGQWHSQASTSRANGGSSSIIDYFWNLAVGTDRIISRTLGAGLTNSALGPALSFGDAPWSANNERLSGRLRGMQMFQAQLNNTHIAALGAMEYDADVLAYCTANSLTPWYVNMNPTPSDISDKSGAGHNPAWINANQATLWTGP